MGNFTSNSLLSHLSLTFSFQIGENTFSLPPIKRPPLPFFSLILSPLLSFHHNQKHSKSLKDRHMTQLTSAFSLSKIIGEWSAFE